MTGNSNNEAVRSVAAQNGVETVWIALYGDLFKEERFMQRDRWYWTWKWMNADGGFDTNVPYSYWNDGEPDSIGAEQCVATVASGKWFNVQCSNVAVFLCQKPKPGDYNFL